MLARWPNAAIRRCSCVGSTGAGYERYAREHHTSMPPAAASLTLSADEAFLGRPDHFNPEQLLVLARRRASYEDVRLRAGGTLSRWTTLA